MAASRIYDLVGAIKGFTQMDREGMPEPVDIGQGLANTLVVLSAKAKEQVDRGWHDRREGSSARKWVRRRTQPGVGEPDRQCARCRGRGRPGRDGRAIAAVRVVVRVVDDGPGVPAEIRDRIFDPFFTTKPVGKGTGLGLDIVRRLIQRHNGQIELNSSPGRTEFRVTLPIAGVG